MTGTTGSALYISRVRFPITTWEVYGPIYRWKAWYIVSSGQRAAGQFDAGLTSRHLLENYRYTGIADPGVYKDPVASRLISNYLAFFKGLVREMDVQNRQSEALRIIEVAKRTIPPESVGQEVWYSLMHESYRQLAVSYHRAGKPDSASLCLAELIRICPYEGERKRLRAVIQSLKTTTETEPEAGAQDR